MAEGSAAAAAGVAASDVITHVAGQQVGSLAGFKSVMVNAMLEGGASLSLSLLRPPPLGPAAAALRAREAHEQEAHEQQWRRALGEEPGGGRPDWGCYSADN